MIRRRLAVSAMALAVCVPIVPTAFAAPAGQQAVPNASAIPYPVTVRVTIERISARDCHDPDEVLGGCGSDSDLWARVHIAEHTSDTEERVDIDKSDVQPNWVFEHSVDLARGRVPVIIRVRDQDGVFRGPSDQVDVRPGPGRDLELGVNLAPCGVSGDLTQRCSEGDVSTGTLVTEGDAAIRARLQFRIDVIDVDSDGDSLLDGWEARGLDVDGDGIVDLALGQAPYNANPRRKDLFVEVDYMDCAEDGCAQGDNHSHKPASGALPAAATAFANAPVTNPDGSTGVALHGMLDEAVDEIVDVRFSADDPGTASTFDELKNGDPAVACTGRFGTSAERASGDCVKILTAKREVFRYAVFGHSHSKNSKSSGIGELHAKGGNDFMVTLGNFSAGAISAAGGQEAAEAATFMHELGHTLGLDHGGFEEKNCKPNYLSVMNYTLQFAGIDRTRPLDFSAEELPSLNETSLNEPDGVGGPAGRSTVYGQGDFTPTGPANGPIDWNGINGDQEAGVAADIDFVQRVTDCDSASPGDTGMRGHDDWAGLVYGFRESPSFADGVPRPTPTELTSQDIVRMTPEADLSVAKTVDLVDATPGDTLAYRVVGRNAGPGDATGVTITDTLPDGTAHQRKIGELRTGASRGEAFSFNVPCATPDGSVLVNRARIAGTNMALVADRHPANNTASASTTVHAPRLTLTKSTSETARAGEAIVNTLTYENAGSGAAAEVVVSDTLPNEVYYSEALDAGAGPKPTSVERNADGTTTLIWSVNALTGHSGPRTIEYTTRAGLLVTGGTVLDTVASVDYRNENGCDYAAVIATGRTTVTEVAPSRDPLTIGYWHNHAQQWDAETLARIQATDTRFDGADGSLPDGVLTGSEVDAAFSGAGGMPRVTEWQILGAYFNLATRRVNASTFIDSRTTQRLGLVNVRQAGLFAQETLTLEYTKQTQERYSDATQVLDEINRNRSPVY